MLSKFNRKIDYEKGGFFNEEDVENVNSLVTKSTTLLVSLVEGTTD